MIYPIYKVNPVRWLVLLAVILNTLFNFFYSYILPNAATIESVSNQYHTLFTPSAYVFSIWILIYLSFLVYAVYQLLPSQRANPLYDSLAGPLIAVNFLSIMWIIAFTRGYIVSSVFIICCMLVCGAMLYSLTGNRNSHCNLWIKFPFRIFLGWISVATLINITCCIVSLNGNDPGVDQSYWTIVMIVGICIFGLALNDRYKDPVYPLVICWACAGIGVANIYHDSTVSTTAFIISILMLLWTFNSIFLYYVSHQNVLSDDEDKNPQTDE